MSEIEQVQGGPTEDEKDARADGRAAEQETADAAEESAQQTEPVPEVTNVEVASATPVDEDSSGGEVPPVMETDGNVEANAERLNAGSEIAKGVTDEDDDGDLNVKGYEGEETTADETDEDTGDGEGSVALDTAAALLGKLQALANGNISREEARQWLEENYPE